MLQSVCGGIFDDRLQDQERYDVITKVASLTAPQSDIIPTNPNLSLIFTSQCRGVTLQKMEKQGKIGTLYMIKTTKNEVIVGKTIPYKRNIPGWKVEESNATGGVCIPSLQPGTILLGLDEFTNDSLIGYIIRTVLEQNKMSSIACVYHYAGGYSSDRGMIIMEYAELGNLLSFSQRGALKLPPMMGQPISPGRLALQQPSLTTSSLLANKTSEYGVNKRLRDDLTSSGYIRDVYVMNSDVTVGIISQVTMSIHYLGRALQFSSGDLKAENILVYPKPMMGTYKSLNLKCPVTCKISDFGKSSLSIQRLDGRLMRIYNETAAADLYMKLKSFNPKIYMDRVSARNYYIVDQSFTNEVYVWMRHSGHPYYRSFDYYTFMLSILSIPAYYFSFFSSADAISKFWIPMWLSDTESAEMQKIIHDRAVSVSRLGMNSIIEILKDKRLMCDVIDIIVG